MIFLSEKLHHLTLISDSTLTMSSVSATRKPRAKKGFVCDQSIPKALITNLITPLIKMGSGSSQNLKLQWISNFSMDQLSFELYLSSVPGGLRWLMKQQKSKRFAITSVLIKKQNDYSIVSYPFAQLVSQKNTKPPLEDRHDENAWDNWLIERCPKDIPHDEWLECFELDNPDTRVFIRTNLNHIIEAGLSNKEQYVYLEELLEYLSTQDLRDPAINDKLTIWNATNGESPRDILYNLLQILLLGSIEWE